MCWEIMLFYSEFRRLNKVWVISVHLSVDDTHPDLHAIISLKLWDVFVSSGDLRAVQRPEATHHLDAGLRRVRHVRRAGSSVVTVGQQQRSEAPWNKSCAKTRTAGSCGASNPRRQSESDASKFQKNESKYSFVIYSLFYRYNKKSLFIHFNCFQIEDEV